MSKVAIKVADISKVYKLYDRPKDRLKEALGFSRKKLYREHYALSHVNFEVAEGETIGIIGTNGSGKSTILKIITGVLNPTEGEVTVNGRISALLELGAGFNMEYTGIENIYLNGTMIGFSKEEIDSRLQDILDFADIGDFVNQPVKTYSSGMFVRLAFAVAINIDPEILIVDEALSVGDVFFQNKCYQKFEEFKKMGKTILIVSHDLSSISKYCDRVILLNKGKKIIEGSPKETVDLYKKLLVNQLDLSEFDGTAEPKVEELKAKLEENVPLDLWKSGVSANPNVSEYGTKGAEIVDYGIFDESGNVSSTIVKGEEFTVKMKVKFHEEVRKPIFAYTIKDLRGTDLTGTNTAYENVKIEKQEAGDVRIISFRQKMRLQGGEYLLSLGCTGFRNSELNVYHRLYDVCNISVVSDKNTIGFFDIESEVEIDS